MTYSGLATKFRPKKFRQIVGQPDVPVIRAVFRDLDELPPLLLFSGPSGVGKTTIARIIAATVNCVSRADDGEPCGQCEHCLAVLADNHLSVYEMDAASHGTAEALRDLVSKTRLHSLGTKTFILDEAQSISAQGWNVLLKVLEEPPPNCLFILLTSEPRKVPTKIRTRALRFNFKEISPAVIHKYLGAVTLKNELQVTDDDVSLITDLSEGSLRDALMMLEQCTLSSFSAEDLFGARDLSLDYFFKVLHKDYEGALTTVSQWWVEVGDAKTIVSQMAGTLEKIAHSKSGIEFYGGVSSASRYKELSDILDMNTLAACLESLSDWFTQVYTKAQLVLLTARLYKVVNGSTASNESLPVSKPPTNSKQHAVPVATSELRSRFKGL